MLSAVEGVGSRLVNRNCDSLGRGVGVEASVNCNCFPLHARESRLVISQCISNDAGSRGMVRNSQDDREMSISTQPGEVDAKFARDAWLRALAKTATIGERGITLPALIDRLAGQFNAAPALISAEASMSHGQLGFRCNQYSRWAIGRALKSGDVVSLFMSNCAEYPAIWLGLTRIGVVVALVNSQLAGDGLAHSINIADPRYLIVGADLAPRIADIRPQLPASLACRVMGSSTEDLKPMEPELAAVAGEPLLSSERAAPSIDATALYIYTSGTTGLPKAAKVSHYRLMQWSHWFAGMMDTR